MVISDKLPKNYGHERSPGASRSRTETAPSGCVFVAADRNAMVPPNCSHSTEGALMQIRVGGIDASVNNITFSELSLDKRGADRAQPYQVIVEAQDFTQSFQPVFESCIAELVRDDQVTGKFNPPYKRAENYPSLDEFLALPELMRMEMVDAFFEADILRLYLREDVVAKDTQWVVLSLDSLVRQRDKVVIRSRAVASA